MDETCNLNLVREADALADALAIADKHEPTEHCPEYAEYVRRPFCFAVYHPAYTVFNTTIEARIQVLRFQRPDEAALWAQALIGKGATVKMLNP